MLIKFKKLFYRHKAVTVVALLLIILLFLHITLALTSYITISAPNNITDNKFTAANTLLFVQKSPDERMNNTLMYYKNILEDNNSYSVDGFEVDVFISKDNKLVVSSYEKLDQISDATLPPFNQKNVLISAKNIGELKQYNIAYNIAVEGEYIYRNSQADLAYARVITLDELLNYLKSQSTIWKKTFKLIINIDGKNRDRIISTLNALLSLYNYYDYCVIVPKTNADVKLIATFPQLKRTATTSETIRFFYSGAFNIKNTEVDYSLLYIDNGAYGINFAKKRYVSYASYIGVPLILSNANSLNKINSYASIAPSGISGSDAKEIYQAITK